jgi:hypothetical protein
MGRHSRADWTQFLTGVTISTETGKLPVLPLDDMVVLPEMAGSTNVTLTGQLRSR